MILRNNAFYFKIIKAPSLLQNYRSKGNEIHNLGRDSFSSQRVCLFTPRNPKEPQYPHMIVSFLATPRIPLGTPMIFERTLRNPYYRNLKPVIPKESQWN